MRDDLADVGLGVAGQQLRAAAIPGGGEQGGLIAADRRNAVERAAVAAEPEGMCGEIVFMLDQQHLIQSPAIDAIEDFAAFGAAWLDGEAWQQLSIGQDAAELLRVFEQKLPLSGMNVD